MLIKTSTIIRNLLCVTFTIGLSVYCMLFSTLGVFLQQRNDKIQQSIIRKDAQMIEKKLNMSMFYNEFKKTKKCMLQQYPDIPVLDFSIKKAVILYFDGSEEMFSFLVSSVNIFQNESVVILTFQKGLAKCILLGVRCVDMSLILTSEQKGCSAKRVLFSDVNMCLPCYLYFFLLKGIEVIKLDLDIMCKNNVDIWSILKNDNGFGSFCLNKLLYSTAAFRVKSSKVMTTAWQKICEISFKSRGMFGISDILPSMVGSSFRLEKCSLDIVDYTKLYHQRAKPMCVYVPNVDLDKKISIFRELDMWYGNKKINSYFNVDQSYLAYYLRLNYKDKTYPLDVSNQSAFHSYSRYGGRRGSSLGRYYLHKWLYKYIEKYINVDGSYDCLEIGDGHFIDRFLEHHCKSKQSLDLNDKKATLKGNIEFPDKHLHGKFDIIICAQVLEHVDYPEQAMHGLNLLLKREGTVFLTVPFISPIHGFPHDVTRFTSTGIKKIAKTANFEIAAISTLGNSLTSIGYMLEMSEEDFWPYELNKNDNFQYFGVYAVLKKTAI